MGAGGGRNGSGTGGGNSMGGSMGSAGGSSGGGDCSSYTICDDFEGAAPGATGSPWKTSMASGYTVTVVTTPVHGGTHALHIASPTGTGHGYLTATKGFPATDFWGRAYMRVTSAATGHQCFIELNTSGDQVRVVNEMGSGEFASNIMKADTIHGSTMKVPQNTWFCFEWHQSPTALHLYSDGTEIPGTAATWSVASISSMNIGHERFQSGSGMADIYYDDIAVNTTRIGCN